MKVGHKINHGWIRPGSPLSSESTSDRYETEIDTTLRKAAKAHQRAVNALERAEARLKQTSSPEAAKTVQDIRAEVERRYLELREIELLMQAGPSTGANRSGKGSVRNPLPKGTKL